MKLIFTLLIFTFSQVIVSNAQTVAGNFPAKPSGKTSANKLNLNGQWKGTFDETSSAANSLLGNSNTTYVLELNIDGSKVTGYSYTYFTDLGPKRYYTICRITGSFNRSDNSMIVTEVERVRYNTPPNILNCFQVHRLKFEKGDGNAEYLKGDWFPAPDQNCGGSGTTVLSRETVTRTPFAVKLPPKKNEVAKNSSPSAPRHSARPAAPSHKTQPAAPKPDTKATVPEIPREQATAVAPPAEKKLILNYPPAPVYKGYEKRKNEVVKSIRIGSPVFQVDFYDNGIIDGDTISVFFNGKLIISHKMLTASPLTLTLSIDKNYKNNIITMYAENLGSIPPNTAVMIVRDGETRHEVRMESDLGKSGSVVFTHDDD